MTLRKGAKRISVARDVKDIQQIDLLAEKRGMTRTEWVNWAIDHAIEETFDQYSLSGLTAQRINQMQHSVIEMTESLDNLSNILLSFIKGMNNLVSGDNYLNDAGDDDYDGSFDNNRGEN